MSSTNHTTNYGLSQFLGTDKPAWLVDYNGDMAAIDTQMKANADAASGAQTTANTADGKADANASAISTIDTQINGASGIASDVTTLQGSVNSINSLIGNGEPTTSDKTLIGAINELAGDIATIESASEVIRFGITVTADGVKTRDALATELVNAYTAHLAELGDNERSVLLFSTVLGIDTNVIGAYKSKGGTGSFSISHSLITQDHANMRVFFAVITGTTNRLDEVNIPVDGTTPSYVDLSSAVPANGTQLGIWGIDIVNR